ncbi:MULTISPECIES: sodium:calcium antiporter [Haloarcula]|uniref:Sodium:calcium antiporter n=1 Tax=Haloarcula pellucida TaxID=1427151 RepID=A0A830GLE7_9EURY|nr:MULTISPECIES: sodium:calcium antiporter [Halomicroarcula]MBX0348505.1 sodium:calcium antiporter [Halomicroarcula pellucida]MDS0278330.1 sodium:calcium antiporter [Halomicroarcula sp. S1AR25-4]GGN93033.1 sodium:calcium antiporter [Halomicroarcula pellucida]
MVLFDALFVGVAVVALWFGADRFVTGAGRIARQLGVPGLVVGLTVVAFGTSAPEFAVTIDAALAGQTDISVANVVGSNVLNLGFVLGGVALVRSLATSRALVRRDSVLLVVTTVALLGLVVDGRLGRLEGALLFAGLLGYLLYLARNGGDQMAAAVDQPFHWPDVGRLVAGLGLVVGGGHLLVLSAVDIAQALGISEWVIGITVVAAGTSLPEFVTSLAAARQGRTGISAGSLVGSCIFNVLGVLGLAAVVHPLPVTPVGIEGTAWLLGTVVLVTVLFYTDAALSRLEGGVLVALNAANWLANLF